MGKVSLSIGPFRARDIWKDAPVGIIGRLLWIQNHVNRTAEAPVGYFWWCDPRAGPTKRGDHQVG